MLDEITHKIAKLELENASLREENSYLKNATPNRLSYTTVESQLPVSWIFIALLRLALKYKHSRIDYTDKFEIEIDDMDMLWACDYELFISNNPITSSVRISARRRERR